MRDWSRRRQIPETLSDINSFVIWGGGMFPATYPGNVVMSVIPKDCKIVKKSDALPKLFNHKLVESKYKEYPICARSWSWCRVEILNLSVKYEQCVLTWDSILTTSMSVKIVCGWANDSPTQFLSERRWSIGSMVSTTGDQTSSMRRGMCGSPTSTGVWWRMQMGAKSAPNQVKALSQSVPEVPMEKSMNLGSLTNAGN